MSNLPILDQYQQALIGTLGSITAHTLVSSRESSRVIRECSKVLDNLSVELRKQLLAAEKLLVMQSNQE